MTRAFLALLGCCLAGGILEGLPARMAQAAALAPVRLKTASAVASHPGQRVYEQHCAVCHGPQGNGQSPAVRWLYPKPCDFSAGLFKIQSTPAGSLPTDDDLLATLTRGMPGSSMPGFERLPESQRRDVIQYFKQLATFTEANGVSRNRFAEARVKGQSTVPIEVPAEPPATPRSVTKGEALYVRLQCFSCHGDTGRGDGPSAPFLIDHWGYPAPPRDFIAGRFRGGAEGRDLYLRIATGLAGTPMPPFDDAILEGVDRWALVHRLQSMRQPRLTLDRIPLTTNPCIHTARRASIPTSPMDAAWDHLPATRVPLEAEGDSVRTMSAVLRVAHDGTTVGLWLHWNSPMSNGVPVQVEEFHASATVGGRLWEAVRQPLPNTETPAANGHARGIWRDGGWDVGFRLTLGTDDLAGWKLAAGTTIPLTVRLQDDPPHGSQGLTFGGRFQLVLEP